MPSLLRVPAEVGQLAAVRQFVEASCHLSLLPAEIVDPLVLAVDELVVNIIEHGYRGRPGEIEVEVECTREAVIVRLRDQAPLFDPTCLPIPDITLPLEQRPSGGMGVYLARLAVDSLTHQVTQQGGNQLTLVKRMAVL
jgi:serine/threonine-protein kinase RsbW